MSIFEEVDAIGTESRVDDLLHLLLDHVLSITDQLQTGGDFALHVFQKASLFLQLVAHDRQGDTEHFPIHRIDENVERTFPTANHRRQILDATLAQFSDTTREKLTDDCAAVWVNDDFASSVGHVDLGLEAFIEQIVKRELELQTRIIGGDRSRVN